MILAKREGIASEEAMQQPGTIAAIYSLFSKSDGNVQLKYGRPEIGKETRPDLLSSEGGG